MAAVTSASRASSAARRSGVSKPPASVSRIHSTSASGRAAPSTSLDRLAAAGAHEIVGILPFRQAGELQALAGLDQRQREIDGAIGGAPAGGIAVEAQDRLVRHLPEQRELVGGERGAERRDRRLEAGRHHGDHVDIAFDRDRPCAPLCAAARAAAML